MCLLCCFIVFMLFRIPPREMVPGLGGPGILTRIGRWPKRFVAAPFRANVSHGLGPV